MSIPKYFDGYPQITVTCQDTLVRIEIAPCSGIPVIFKNTLEALCQELTRQTVYKSLSIELLTPTGGIPIKHLCPSNRTFTITTEKDRILATTNFL